MKALEILNLYHTHGEDIMFVSFKKYYVEEAIAELEALGNRSCEGCKYYVSPLCPVEEFSTPSAELEKYPFYCNRWEAKQ